MSFPHSSFTGALLYDPDCGICQQCARWAVRYLALRAEVTPGYPDDLLAYGIDRQRFAQAIPYVTENRQLAYGALAIGLALKTSRKRWTRWCGTALVSHPVRPVAEYVYARISANRYRLPGASGACALPPRS